jgi:hypothetical protein
MYTLISVLEDGVLNYCCTVVVVVVVFVDVVFVDVVVFVVGFVVVVQPNSEI